jgi:hypothetical protein
VDSPSISDPKAGICYESFGIDGEGAIVVVRPDNHVGLVVRLDDVQEVEHHFDGFLVKHL